jgi:Arc/MetJ family transcription regulator
MRCSIEVNDALLRKALKATGLSAKRAVVEEGLRMLIKVRGQASIRRLRGKIDFDEHVLETGMENRT